MGEELLAKSTFLFKLKIHKLANLKKCKPTNAHLAEIDEKLERLLKLTDEFPTTFQRR